MHGAVPATINPSRSGREDPIDYPQYKRHHLHARRVCRLWLSVGRYQRKRKPEILAGAQKICQGTNNIGLMSSTNLKPSWPSPRPQDNGRVSSYNCEGIPKHHTTQSEKPEQHVYGTGGVALELFKTTSEAAAKMRYLSYVAFGVIGNHRHPFEGKRIDKEEMGVDTGPSSPSSPSWAWGEGGMTGSRGARNSGRYISKYLPSPEAPFGRGVAELEKASGPTQASQFNTLTSC